MISNLEILFDKIKVFFKSEIIMGKPIEAGNFILIPLLSISFGAGNGSAGGGTAKGGGAGAGGKVTPVAVVVIKDDEIRLFSLNGENDFQEISELIPEVLSFTIEETRNQNTAPS
jgi:uncharacterized spore protein YtfJ